MVVDLLARNTESGLLSDMDVDTHRRWLLVQNGVLWYGKRTAVMVRCEKQRFPPSLPRLDGNQYGSNDHELRIRFPCTL